jgi:hypothetical protein
MKSQKTECTLYLSYDMSVWFRPAATAMEAVGIHIQKKAYSLYSLLNTQTFTFISLWSTETKGVTKMWNLRGEKYIYKGLRCLWHKRLRKNIKCYNQQWFYNAEPLYEEARLSFAQYESNYKIKKRRTSFFFYIFSNWTLQYVILCSLLIKAKSIPFTYHIYCIRYSIFKYNAYNYLSALTGTGI